MGVDAVCSGCEEPEFCQGEGLCFLKHLQSVLDGENDATNSRNEYATEDEESGVRDDWPEYERGLSSRFLTTNDTILPPPGDDLFRDPDEGGEELDAEELFRRLFPLD